jgi:AraC family transcriptional regulator
MLSSGEALKSMPVLSSSPVLWRGFRLERLENVAINVPAQPLPYHLISVNISNRPITRYAVGEGKRIRVDLDYGFVTVVSRGVMRRNWSHIPMDLLVVQLDSPFVRNAAEDLCCPQSFEALEPGTQDTVARDLAFALECELRAGCPGGRLAGEELANRAAAHLLRRYALGDVRWHDYRGPLSRLLLLRTLDFIEDNIGTQLGVVELAHEARLSPYHFGKLFHATTGRTIHQYVMWRRVERAKLLLRDPSWTLSRTSAALGFAQQSHFTAVFRRFVGTTPQVYRSNLISVSASRHPD